MILSVTDFQILTLFAFTETVAYLEKNYSLLNFFFCLTFFNIEEVLRNLFWKTFNLLFGGGNLLFHARN